MLQNLLATYLVRDPYLVGKNKEKSLCVRERKEGKEGSNKGMLAA